MLETEIRKASDGLSGERQSPGGEGVGRASSFSVHHCSTVFSLVFGFSEMKMFCVFYEKVLD